jgi:hypothetical protein
MILKLFIRFIMDNTRNRKRRNSLSDRPIEYQSKATIKDLSDADLRSAEVKNILEEILRLGRRRVSKSRQTEADKDVA